MTVLLAFWRRRIRVSAFSLGVAACWVPAMTEAEIVANSVISISVETAALLSVGFWRKPVTCVSYSGAGCI